MRSAFGVEHGEISKARGTGVASVLGRRAKIARGIENTRAEWAEPGMRYHRGVLKATAIGGIGGTAGYQGGKAAVKNSKKR